MHRLETAETIEQLNSSLAGRYVIAREIGHGGMATVYLARDLRHERSVALKVLLAELGAILGPERFLSEIRVTANLQHPNLLPLFDSGEANGRLFYVMPFIEGESLRHRLSREKQLPIDEAIRITTACAGALEYAHRNGVIHRDLKPENILLSAGQPVISDFGIALAVSNAGGARITQSGLSLGTPQYMSPEQAAGDREVDGRTDVYSLACVLYEMLTGDPPHTGSTVQAVIAKVLVEKPGSVRARRELVPRHVDAAIDRALTKLPADRWATAAQFGAALTDPEMTAGIGLPSSEVILAKPTRARKAISLRNVVWPAIAFGAAIIAAAAWWRLGSRAPATPVTFTVPTPPSARLATDPSTVLFTPDGSSIVYAAAVGGRRRMYLRRLTELAPREMRGADDAVLPFLSPDGNWIAYGTESGGVYKVPLSGGSPIQIAQGTALRGQARVNIGRTLASVRGGSWSHRGDIVMGSDSGLYRILKSGGQPELFTKPDRTIGELSHSHPMFLTDGKTILFRIQDQASRANDRLGVASLDESGHNPLGIGGGNPIAVIDGKLVFGRTGGSIAAVAFDSRKARVTGDPVTILEDVSVFSGAAASITQSGSVVYVKSSNASRLIMTGQSSGKPAAAEEARRYFYPRLGPDGRSIAIQISGASGQTHSDIWSYDTRSRVLSRVTSQANAEQPEWTPDGRYIIYHRFQGGKWEVWRIAADGSGAEQRFFASAHPVREMSFAPNGALAVFTLNDPATNRDVWLLTLDSLGRPGKASALLATRFNELAPRVSPDGRWLVYLSDESGRYEVYVRPFARPGPRVQVSANGGNEPMWQPDGLRVVYRAGDKFLEATLGTAPVLSITRTIELFDGRYVSRFGTAQYDLDRAGNGFILLEPIGTPEIVVLLNGLGALLSTASAER